MGVKSAWLVLFVAGLFEVAWAIGLKHTHGFTKLVPSVLTIIGAWISLFLLSVALKYIPVGTAYSIWTGIGAVGIALLGIYLFNEPRDPLRLFFIGVIIVGIVGLRMVSP
jgi:quaternary ammonium compound-resistance protein SugE